MKYCCIMNQFDRKVGSLYGLPMFQDITEKEYDTMLKSGEYLIHCVDHGVAYIRSKTKEDEKNEEVDGYLLKSRLPKHLLNHHRK